MTTTPRPASHDAPSIEALRAQLTLLRRDRIAALRPLKNCKAHLEELARAHAPEDERAQTRAQRDVHANRVRELSREIEAIERQLAGFSEARP
jgi:hypothetical protein